MSLLKYLKNRTIFFFALIVSSTLIGFMLKGIGLNVLLTMSAKKKIVRFFKYLRRDIETYSIT